MFAAYRAMDDEALRRRLGAEEANALGHGPRVGHRSLRGHTPGPNRSPDGAGQVQPPPAQRVRLHRWDIPADDDTAQPCSPTRADRTRGRRPRPDLPAPTASPDPNPGEDVHVRLRSPSPATSASPSNPIGPALSWRPITPTTPVSKWTPLPLPCSSGPPLRPPRPGPRSPPASHAHPPPSNPCQAIDAEVKSRSRYENGRQPRKTVRLQLVG